MPPFSVHCFPLSQTLFISIYPFTIPLKRISGTGILQYINPYHCWTDSSHAKALTVSDTARLSNSLHRCCCCCCWFLLERSWPSTKWLYNSDMLFNYEQKRFQLKQLSLFPAAQLWLFISKRFGKEQNGRFKVKRVGDCDRDGRCKKYNESGSSYINDSFSNVLYFFLKKFLFQKWSKLLHFDKWLQRLSILLLFWITYTD